MVSCLASDRRVWRPECFYRLPGQTGMCVHRQKSLNRHHRRYCFLSCYDTDLGTYRSYLVLLCAILYCRYTDRRQPCFHFLKAFTESPYVIHIPDCFSSQSTIIQIRFVNDSLGIAFLGFIGYLASSVAVKQFVAEPGPVLGSIKYIVLLPCCNGSVVYWNTNKKHA